MWRGWRNWRQHLPSALEVEGSKVSEGGNLLERVVGERAAAEAEVGELPHRHEGRGAAVGDAGVRQGEGG
jgi:hypothetical protein